MTEKDVVTMLKKLKIPLAYRSFSTPQKPPFMVYYRDSNSYIKADDTNYATFKNIVVELYTDKKDFALEAKTEKLFDDNGIVYEAYETYISEEKLHEVIYEFQI